MAEMYENMIQKLYNFMKEHYWEIIIAGILSKIFYREED